MIQFPIETLTLEQLQEIIASGNDNYDNQIRCTKDGQVFLSENIVGADNLSNIAFRFETFDAHNDYVGPAASNDLSLMNRLYIAMKENWNKNCPNTYIDMF